MQPFIDKIMEDPTLLDIVLIFALIGLTSVISFTFIRVYSYITSLIDKLKSYFWRK